MRARPSPGRPLLAGLTCANMGAATFAGPAVGILASTLIDEFSITRADIGRLAAAYALVGAAVSPLTGRLADRIGGRWMLVVNFVLGALVFVVFAGARSYVVLFLGAAISGIPNGASNQGTNRLIATLVPPTERGLITGIKQSGVQLWRFLGGVLVPSGVALFGLRPTLVIVAGVSALGAAATLLLLPDDRAADHATQSRAAVAPLPEVVWWLTGYAFLLGAGAGATSAFTALYAEERLGLAPTTSGLLIGLTGAVAVVARVWLSRATQAVDHYARPLGQLALVAAGSLALLAAAEELGPWALWLSSMTAAASLGSWNSVVMLASMATVPVNQVGRAAGRVMAGFLGGLGVGPTVFGAVVERIENYPVCWLGAALASAGAYVSTRIWAMRDEPVSRDSRTVSRADR